LNAFRLDALANGVETHRAGAARCIGDDRRSKRDAVARSK